MASDKKQFSESVSSSSNLPAEEPINFAPELLDGQVGEPSHPVLSHGPGKAANWQEKNGPATSLLESFYHAFRGLGHGFLTQRNLRIHFVLAVAALALGFALQIEVLAWACLAIAIAFVIFAEFINTAIEHVVDIQANYRYHLAARYAKDSAAAAVLVAACGAAFTGLAIFGPRLWLLVKDFF